MVKKTKVKFLLALMLIVLLISTYCYATEPADATESTDGTLTISEEDLNNLLASGAVTTADPSATQTPDTSDWTYKDYFACDQNVVVDGIIDGNAFVIGQEVTIKGEIGGDLFVMAQKLNIDGGYVYSSIFAMAEEITMNGISYDLYAMCSSFKLQNNGYVYRDLKVAGNDISLAGKIRRNAFIVGNSLNFDETVGTVIYGDLDYTSGAAEYTAPEGAVAGEIKYQQEKVENSETEVDPGAVAKVSVGAIIVRKIKELVSILVTTLLVTLFLILVTPKFTKKLSEMKVGKAFASLGVGILSWPVFLIASSIVIGITLLILIFTLGAIDQLFYLSLILSSILFLVLLLVSIVGSAVACTYFGKLFAKLIKKDGKLFTILFSLLSALVLWVVCLIPVLGGLVGFLAWTFGVGVVIVNLLPSKKEKAE
ncbi:MAG: hypothetical protein J6M60_07815 [Clostridia bacterium]|nr:hypothetical protein [Clostridia bacterium]